MDVAAPADGDGPGVYPSDVPEWDSILAPLDEQERKVVTLRIRHAETHKMIGKLLGLTKGQVGTLLNRAFLRIRRTQYRDAVRAFERGCRSRFCRRVLAAPPGVGTNTPGFRLKPGQLDRLLELAKSAPPVGRRWSSAALARTLIETGVVGYISSSAVRAALQKAGLNRAAVRAKSAAAAGQRTPNPCAQTSHPRRA